MINDIYKRFEYAKDRFYAQDVRREDDLLRAWAY